MDVMSQVGLRLALTIAPPNEADIKYGYLRGFVSDRDAVDYFLGRLTSGAPVSAVAERIALLLSDEYDQVDHLISDLPSPVDLDSRRFWILVSLQAALNSRPRDIQDVEDVYEFFDSDESLLPFVPWVRIDSPMPTDRELFGRVETFVGDEIGWARATRMVGGSTGLV